MRWPWNRDKRLAQVRQEQREIKSKGKRQEELARKAEQHLSADPFGERFRAALGGR